MYLTAVTESYFPSTALLSSIWLFNDEKLLKDLQFNISVLGSEKKEKMFDYFKLKPKICDSMMFCKEGEMVNDPVPDTVEREYRYKFSKISHSEYVKLVFHIEYFVPRTERINDNTIDVEFEMDLIHFGNPCHEHKCPNKAECVKDPKQLLPTDSHCECPSSFKGPNCDEKNHCADSVSSYI
jgi:hypothetical protein